MGIASQGKEPKARIAAGYGSGGIARWLQPNRKPADHPPGFQLQFTGRVQQPLRPLAGIGKAGQIGRWGSESPQMILQPDEGFGRRKDGLGPTGLQHHVMIEFPQ